MKMNLDMSFEEGLNIIEALRECAINNGWDENELNECGVIDEYCRAVDAALTAMGISVSIDNEPKAEAEDEDENQYCDSAADCFFCNSDEEDDDFNSDDDEEEDEDDELPSDDEVFRLIRRVLYGQ